MKRLTALLPIAILVTACGSTPSDGLAEAVDSCAPAGLVGIELADEGKSIIIDGSGKSGGGATISKIACVLTALDTPSSVVARMDGTRALDGRQEAEWGNYKASWTYHPDNGFDVIVELAN